VELTVQTFHFLTGFAVILGMMFFFKVSLSVHLLEFFVIAGVNAVLIYGLTLLVSHLGVFFLDIKNIMNILLRLLFYLTPIFYDVASLPERLRMIWWFNPLTTMIESYRNVVLYGRSPYYLQLFIWLVISSILLLTGIKIQQKYGNLYAKVK
jgi:ABC-type polysaccharide/polyol phosphate export permease